MNAAQIYETLCENGAELYKGCLVLPFPAENLSESEEEDAAFVKSFLSRVISKEYPDCKQATVLYRGRKYQCVKGPTNEISEGLFKKIVMATLLLAAAGWIGAKMLSAKKHKTLKVLKVDKAKKKILVDFEGEKQWLSPSEFHNIDPQPKTGAEATNMESMVGQDIPYLPCMPLYMREELSGWTMLPAGAEMTVVAEDKDKLTVDVDGADYYIPCGKALDAQIAFVKENYSTKQIEEKWGWNKDEATKLLARLEKASNVTTELMRIGQCSLTAATRYLKWFKEAFDVGQVKGLMAQDRPRPKRKEPGGSDPNRGPAQVQNRDRKIVKKANSPGGKKKTDDKFFRPLGGEGESTEEQGPFDPEWPTAGKAGRGAGWQDLPKAWAQHFDPEDLPEMKCGCPGPGSCVDNSECPCPEDCPCKEPVEAISESAAVNYYYWYARYHEPSSHYTSDDTEDEHVTEVMDRVVEHVMSKGARGLLTEFYGPLGNTLARLASNEPGRFDKRSRYYRQFEKHFCSAYKKVYREKAPDHVLRRMFREWMNRGRGAIARGNLRHFVRSRTQGMPGPQMMGIARG